MACSEGIGAGDVYHQERDGLQNPPLSLLHRPHAGLSGPPCVAAPGGTAGPPAWMDMGGGTPLGRRSIAPPPPRFDPGAGGNPPAPPARWRADGQAVQAISTSSGPLAAAPVAWKPTVPYAPSAITAFQPAWVTK